MHKCKNENESKKEKKKEMAKVEKASPSAMSKLMKGK